MLQVAVPLLTVQAQHNSYGESAADEARSRGPSHRAVRLILEANENLYSIEDNERIATAPAPPTQRGNIIDKDRSENPSHDNEADAFLWARFAFPDPSNENEDEWASDEERLNAHDYGEEGDSDNESSPVPWRFGTILRLRTEVN